MDLIGVYEYTNYSKTFYILCLIKCGEKNKN